MTSSQMKRIRSKLAQAVRLTAEADDLVKAGYADHTLRSITARAADDMTAAQDSLKIWDEHNAMVAASIARDMAH